jgi:hypothetical protein
MEKRRLTILILLVMALLPVKSQTPVERKLLVTLQPNEDVLYSESCLNLSMNADQFYLVTLYNNKIYTYENGQKKGPFNDPEEAEIKKCSSGYSSDFKCSIYDTQIPETDPQSLQTNNDGSFSIKLNNKTYGPYPFIAQLYIWPDKSGFVATTMSKDMKMSLITSEGLNLPLNGDIEKIHFSPKGKKFIFALKERQDVDMSILNTDFSKMSQEELITFAKKQEEKANSAPKLNSYVYVNGTTKLGPYDLNAFYSDNPGFTKTGGENWIMTLNNALYINGTKVKDFPDMDLNACKTWVSSDGKRYVVISYDKIVFSDGKSYENPVEFTVEDKGGKLLVKWVSFENEKDLVLYSKSL